MQLDVTVSSIGDAKSLEGGVLCLAPLHGPDGQVYAEAQGPLTLGGFRRAARAIANSSTIRPWHEYRTAERWSGILRLT